MNDEALKKQAEKAGKVLEEWLGPPEPEPDATQIECSIIGIHCYACGDMFDPRHESWLKIHQPHWEGGRMLVNITSPAEFADGPDLWLEFKS